MSTMIKHLHEEPLNSAAKKILEELGVWLETAEFQARSGALPSCNKSLTLHTYMVKLFAEMGLIKTEVYINFSSVS